MYFDQKAFGRRMSSCRMGKDLTQEQLAEILGVNRQHISRIERGISAVSIDLLVEISTALDVSTDFLLKGTANKEDEMMKQFETVKKQLLDIAQSM